MKKLLLVLSLIFVGVSYADLYPCPFMSKDPKCWEGRDHTHVPKPMMCPVREECNVVESVIETEWGYSCKGLKDTSFDCTDLVEQYGEQIQGEAVLVINLYVDACKKPGACGMNACVPGWGSAKISTQCQ